MHSGASSLAEPQFVASADDGKWVCGRYVIRAYMYHNFRAQQVTVVCLPSTGGYFPASSMVPFSFFNRLRRALARVDAHSNGQNTVYWTSLREVRLPHHIYVPSSLRRTGTSHLRCRQTSRTSSR